MHLKPGEVVVGRRLYRSGQSEYLINGRVARLRDIQDLFMGIGLGPDSYAIIEQGRIGQILSSKPTDRRAIIEEAAGITKFKTKRRLSEAKLESSKVNLSRINDIYVEVEKQLASLKRQASKARRYAEIREQMRGLLRQVLASKAKELDIEAERLARLSAKSRSRNRRKRNRCTNGKPNRNGCLRAPMNWKANCGSTRTFSDKRRSNSTAARIAFSSTGSAPRN